MKNITAILTGIILLTFFNTKAQVPTAFFYCPSPVCACSHVNYDDSTTNSPTLWKWYFEGGNPSTYTTTTAPGNPPSITYCTPGFYKTSLVVSNSFGSDSVYSINYAVAVDSLPVIKVNPPSGGICDTAGNQAFDTVYFTASGATSYHWAPSYGLSCINCPNPSAYPGVTTIYTVTGTSASGCTASITDTVLAGNIVATIWGKDTICPGTSDTLIASGGASNPSANTQYHWSNGSTTSKIIVSPTISKTYSCTIISGGGSCTSTAKFTVSTACISGIQNLENNSGFILMPNPATTQLSIVFTKQPEEQCEIIITNILGKEMSFQSINPNQKEYQLDVSKFANGMYFIELKTPSSFVVEKFIKE